MTARKLKPNLNYHLSVEDRLKITQDFTIDPRNLVFEKNLYQPQNDKLILLADDLNSTEVLGLALDRKTTHIAQNSLQPIAEKLNLIHRISLDRNEFFDPNFAVFDTKQLVKNSFSQSMNRDVFIESLFKQLSIDSGLNRHKMLYQVLNEMIMNTQINAAEQSTNRNQKDSIIRIERSDYYLSVSIVDYYGSLNCQNLLKIIHQVCVAGFDKSIRYGSKGAGIGSAMIYDHCDSYIIGCIPGLVTRVSIVIPFNLSENETQSLQKSLLVI